MGLKKSAVMPQTAAAANPENAKPAETAVAVADTPVLQDTSVAAEAVEEVEEVETEIASAETTDTVERAVSVNQGAGQLSTDTQPVDAFGALDNKIGFGAFPILKLDKTSFSLGSKEIGSEAFVVMKGARPKFLYKEKGKQETDNLFYTYDHKTYGNGSSVPAILAEWKAKGIEPEVKEYMEVLCKLVERDGKGGWAQLGVCLASIPPASVTRLSGYRYEVTSVDHLKLDAVVTRCFVGDKVTFGKTTFHPWNFEVAATSV